MIKINNLNKKFKNKVVLENINLDLEDSKFYLLIGENGSGKSTLIKILLGYENFNENESFQNKFDIFGYSNDICFFDELSIKENYKYFSYNIDYKKLDLYIDKFGVNEFIYTKFKNCSLGMKKKSFLAFTLAKKNSFILLDEPDTNLDENNLNILINIIQELIKENKTIVLASNIYNSKMFSICDNILQIKDKNVILKKYSNDNKTYTITFVNEDELNKFISQNSQCVIDKNNSTLIINDIFGDDLLKLLSNYKITSYAERK